ncbi:MAG: nicotinate-nucleotide--dimethylbenzimidazole phosphoribosyltransferase, partial [Halieaceae bacterium]|nr:nicotinate-nucleotide--dimethylbenzimidazole phosphoribosyltransferase [Halieaceae bacterium]
MYSKASDVPAPDTVSEEQTAQHLDSLTKPPGSLGRLEELAIWAGGVQGQSPPQPFEQTRLVIFAGDHGVATAAGTSAFPSEVTAQMVANFLTGGAAA